MASAVCDPPCAMPHVSTSVEQLELVVASPWTYAPGEKLYSPIAGPPGGFRCQLRVYPAGTGEARNAISAFVRVLPPEKNMQGWECKNVRCSIRVMSSIVGKEILKIRTHTFTPRDGRPGRPAQYGFHRLVSFQELTRGSGLLDGDSKVRVRASVSNLPFAKPRNALQIDLSAELQPVRILVPDGPPLIFDQRILVARSEYFQKMFAAECKEASTGVVDLRQDANASHQCVSAMLSFLLTKCLDPDVDLELALALHAIADKFCLRDLREAARCTLKDMLSEENVLHILHQVLDIGGHLEKLCWQMLQADGGLLVRQEDQLDAVIQQTPALAKKLILLGKRKMQKTS
ncbi:unnamed protein product [Effrenium voratum]|nr:unnamed protein product [Effrenium voratum]